MPWDLAKATARHGWTHGMPGLRLGPSTVETGPSGRRDHTGRGWAGARC